MFGAWWICSVRWSNSCVPCATVSASISENAPGAWSCESDSWRAWRAPRWRLSDCTRASRRTTVELNWNESVSRDQFCAAT